MVPGEDDLHPIRYGRKLELTDEEKRRLAPPVEYRSPARRSRKGLLIVVIIVLAVVVGAYVGYSYLMSGAKSSPEDTFRRMADAMNEEDWRTAIDCSVDKFASDEVKEAEVAELEAMWAEMGETSVTIQSIQVIKRSDMGPSVLSELDVIVSEVESMYGVDVTDSCGLQFIWIVSQGGVENPVDGTVPLVKVGSAWYLATILF